MADIGFGNNNWFNGFGSNDYRNLVGTPNSFSFDLLSGGSIVNAGSLAVGQGHNLMLLGGSVISTGALTAPGGNIIISAVPGERLVRVSQPGNLLSLEIELPRDKNGLLLPITPLDFAGLLTGNSGNVEMGLRVNSEGGVQMTGSDFGVGDGDVVAKDVTAQTATLSAANNLILVESRLQTTGDLNLLAGDRVLVRDTVANPFVAQAGENLYLQGNQGIDILALNHLAQTPFVSGGNLSLVSDGIISRDAHFVSGGNISILKLSGEPTNFVTLYDPIDIVAGDFSAAGYTGPAYKVQAGGRITFNGDITITSPDANFAGAIPGTDEFLLGNFRALILRAGDDITITGKTLTSNITGDAGPIILQAGGNISTGRLEALSNGNTPGNGGNISLDAGGNIAVTDLIRSALFHFK